MSDSLPLSTDYHRLAEALIDERLTAAAFELPIYRRLAGSLAGVGGPASPADIACLVRQVLLREELRSGREVSLKVPKAAPWPSREEWTKTLVRVVEETRSHYRVRAQLWSPGWLDGVPGQAAFAERERSERRRTPSDPVVATVTGFESYTSPGQKQALRSVLFAPPGSTLCAVLPTGMGKSLLAQVPALRGAGRGLALVVVPTVALALDQERVLLDIARKARVPLPPQLAYYGGQPGGERQAIQERILRDEQGVVFTSPDSLMGSLAFAVHQAASRGGLRLFAVDEAHYVSQWGADFRPEFQAVAGLRRNLLRVSPPANRFVTLLMTATLTQAGLETLKELYGEPGPFQMVSAAALRPEPEFWAADCGEGASAEALREARLKEAVRYLPRPLILYSTTPDQAQRYFDLLCREGFRRVGVMSGRTPGAERHRLVQAWHHGELDVMVGTSAFGVGIDQPNVRTVIHACMPENLDRFYQEVGRGGRDGAASVSLLLHAHDDWQIARQTSTNRLITLERGLERWEAMFVHNTPLGEGRLRLDLNAKPKDLRFSEEENQAWNLRTLNLMARAGLVVLDAEAPPDPSAYEDAVDYERAVQQHQTSAVVQVLENDHRNPRLWEERVAPVRTRQAEADQTGLAQMHALIVAARQKAKFEKILAAAYRIAEGHLEETPSLACGGCPGCRASGEDPYPAEAPFPLPPQHLSVSVDGLWQSLGMSVVPVAYQVPEPARSVPPPVADLLARVLRTGIPMLISSRSSLPAKERAGLQKCLPHPLLWEDPDDLALPELVGSYPRAVLVGPREEAPWLARLLGGDTLTIVFHPESLTDPHRPDRLFMERYPGFTLEQLSRRLG
ncbi:protein DpdF [Calidithermus chliarophilus]|uniref:protein DpdF n=1 Tax=Calidithermus chliarophilus TaxID=52023 RepID=UPI000409F0DD|nr:protein DpdF [Calidithermus chliarophilus]